MANHDRTLWLVPRSRTPPAGPSAVGTALQLRGVHVSNGDIVQAGRDAMVVHNHYHNDENFKFDVLTFLRLVRNLRQLQQDSLSKAALGTGLWFFRIQEFEIWFNQDGRLKILWGTGIPGSGKTVLASIVIHELEARAATKGSAICVAYIYFRYTDGPDLTIRDVLEILVKQTIERHDDCKSIAAMAYGQHVREGTRPSEAELLHLLSSFTATKSATFYIIDALDEAPERLQVEFIKKLASLNARLFISSRPLKAVEARFPEAHGFEIVAQDLDLDLHITQEISVSRDLQDLLERGDPSVKDDIISSIKKNCSGIFLHASLQLNELCGCASLDEAIEILRAFPSGIEDVYVRTWERILRQRARHVHTAQLVLLWVLYSARPMTVGEVERAVAISPLTFSFDAGRIMSREALMTICCGLVTIEDDSKLVRLVHYTAKETLQKLLKATFPDPHALIAAVCTTHLNRCGLQEMKAHSLNGCLFVIQEDPLLAYAYETWAIHSRNSTDTTHASTFISNCRAFPHFPQSPHAEPCDILAPLHIVAFYNLPFHTIERDDVGDPNIMTQIGKSTPLILASCVGNEDMVQALLKLEEIQVNIRDWAGRSALIHGSDNGHENVVELLLTHPDVEVNHGDKEGWTALTRAASKGCVGVARLLITRSDVEVNSLSIRGTSALMEASENGRGEIVELLLERPDLDANLVDALGKSALIHAASKGHAEPVRRLVDHRAIEINLFDHRGWSALTEACSKGHENIVQLLLLHSDVQANIPDHEGCTPLIRAAQKGRVGVVKLLLSHPKIEVNLANDEGCSAIMEAIRYGYPDVVELLRAHPEIQDNSADSDSSWVPEPRSDKVPNIPPSAVNSHSTVTSALIRAVKAGREGTVKLLLGSPNVQVNQVDDEGKTALIWAVMLRRDPIAKLLLQHTGTDVNLTNIQGESALMIAAFAGHEPIVEALLENPRTLVNAVSSDGVSSLMMAVIKGQEGVVKLFVASPRTQLDLLDDEGRSALMWAVFCCQQQIVEILITCPNVDVNLANKEGESALTLAARSGNPHIVKLLLGRSDIQINHVNRAGWTPLILAAASTHRCGPMVVQQLLSDPKIQVNLVKQDREGWSALMWAIRRGNEGSTRLLLDHPDVDVNLTNIEGDSALLMATRHRCLPLKRWNAVEALLTHPKIQINYINSSGCTPLIVAAIHGHQEEAKLLLGREEVQINLVDKSGWTALMHASGRDHASVVKLLLQHARTQPNLTNKDGQSAFVVASQMGFDKVVKLFLRSPGVELNLVDKDGRSALMFAALAGHEQVVRLLLAHPGIQVDALVYAAQKGYLAASLPAVQESSAPANPIHVQPTFSNGIPLEDPDETFYDAQEEL